MSQSVSGKVISRNKEKRTQRRMKANIGEILKTRQSKHCGFCIYLFDKYFDQSKLMVRLVRAEKMVLSGMVFARKIARMILIQNI